MRWRMVLPIISLLLLAGPLTALGQADAERAFEAGKEAFGKGDFEKARELFLAASKTDNRNPEVFLWLGKAHYQLGELDEAIAAWQRTLQLSPEEPYAAKMLDALRHAFDDADVQIALIEVLIEERLFAPALEYCNKLLVQKGLKEAQHAKAMTLRVEALLETAQASQAIAAVHKLLKRFPEHADPARAKLLIGRGKLFIGGHTADEGLALLQEVIEKHAGTPEATAADYRLLEWRIGNRVVEGDVAALKKWVVEHEAHKLARQAKKLLVASYLALAGRQAAPKEDAALSEYELAAIEVASDLLRRAVRTQEINAIAGQVLTHLNARYARNGAFTAGIAGVTSLLKALPPEGRLEALLALARYRTELAFRELTDLARAHKLPDGAMPKALADAVAEYSKINREFPAQAAWKEQAALAERVRNLGALVPWPAKVTRPKAPYTWAVEIALPVIKPNADASAVAEAVKTVSAIVADCSKFPSLPAIDMALVINTDLLSALPADNVASAAAILKQIDLLDAYAAKVFADNVKAGRDEENSKLTMHQRLLLAAMAKLVAQDASYASRMHERLTAHLRPWFERGHYQLAEEAYTQLAAALPKAQKRLVELTVAELWNAQVVREHNMLLAAGLRVPRKLDPLHVKALQRCYLLQDELDEGDALLNRLRGVWDGVLSHYRRLEYWEVVEQGIKVRPEKAVDAAEAYAQLTLANYYYNRARRELAEFLTRYGAAEKIALTDTFKQAIAGYEKFITDWPAGPLVAQAVSRVFSIAQIFEQHQAYDVAIGVYRGFAAFAEKTKVLVQAPPGAPSVLERAEYAAAGALFAKARYALQESLAEKRPQQPPEKISAEFNAAVEAYKAFAKARPESVLIGPAIRQIMLAALEYVNAGAWDVADAIYADLLASGLEIRWPERLELCRGLCQLGKVLPDHAKQVLAALTSPPKTAGKGMPSPTTVLDARHKLGAAAAGGYAAAGLPKDAPAVTAPVKKPASWGDDFLREGDALAMVAIRRQQEANASRIAMLRDKTRLSHGRPQQADQVKQLVPAAPVLSDAEIERQERAFEEAYKVLQSLIQNYPHTATAKQARGEIMAMIDHWRSIAKWERAAKLAEKFLADNPTDSELPKLRLAVARDYLAWASQPVEKRPSTQEMLAEVAARFDKARAKLAGVVESFPDEKSIIHEAQWAIADSFLTQARAVNAFSATLARGQFVRAAKELLAVAERFHDHPQIGQIPQMLWGISQELWGKAYYEEAVVVWNDLATHYPAHELAHKAASMVAQTYRDKLRLPLRAAEVYLELNFARGGSDQSIQNAIFQIGANLKSEKRWVEALHVLETFVDSFPRHPSAGHALTMVGEIHQTNEAWQEAIAAYRRVIDEYPSGEWIRTARWAIAECKINLSLWREAMEAYESYLAAYPKDSKAGEANRRMGVLKDLARYQALVDEKDQRKAFDAQYQIAEMVLNKLSNPVKAIIEYRKAADNWPDSHLADDAMFKIGTTYLAMRDTVKARSALLAVAAKYPNSPLADDALFRVGQSYEAEAQQLATVTREATARLAKEKAQKRAYGRFQRARGDLKTESRRRIEDLRKAGKDKLADMEMARGAAQRVQYDIANVGLFAQQAGEEVEAMTARQLADRQDKINAALRKAVGVYQKAAKVAAADKADESLLRMAVIYADKLKDPEAAMETYLEIVRQFSGTAVAEDASWRIAKYYERQGDYAKAIDAYKAFLRNYRSSSRAGSAQFAVAEGYEHLDKWVEAMDAYTNYINNFPDGPMVQKAREQITWIKTYRL